MLSSISISFIAHFLFYAVGFGPCVPVGLLCLPIDASAYAKEDSEQRYEQESEQDVGQRSSSLTKRSHSLALIIR